MEAGFGFGDTRSSAEVLLLTLCSEIASGSARDQTRHVQGQHLSPGAISLACQLHYLEGLRLMSGNGESTFYFRSLKGPNLIFHLKHPSHTSPPAISEVRRIVIKKSLPSLHRMLI